MKKQLFVCCDMEGASQITDKNSQAVWHGSELWENFGRDCITSDVKAVCDAAIDFGINEIILYDMHFAGDEKPNVRVERLPKIVKFVDVPYRCFDWRRIRGQVQHEPFGMILVGQHARNGEKNAYFPHTIQTPPIFELKVNNYVIAEIGMVLLNFQGVRFLANIGDEASMKEARELCPDVITIPVKNKETSWVPTCKETYELIKSQVKKSLENRESASSVTLSEPFFFSLRLSRGYKFKVPENISWKGNFEKDFALWEAPSAEIGFEILNWVRNCIKKID